MKTTALRTAALAATALLAACSTTGGSNRADVTRFHLGQPVARSTVFVTPVNAADASSLEFRTYAGTVTSALGRTGFTPAAVLGEAEIVAVFGATQTTREALSGGGSGLSVGIGAGTFGRNVGLGGSVNIPVGERKPNEVVVSLIELQLKRRSDNSVIWEGRAMTEARGGSANASLGTVVPALTDALLRDFPGPSGQTVRVKL
ncbi:DUF4136 domain-containing protein [Sphingoaurantiacus capsulatus]|uniref:DUF4136 domain-containing protein n=1 Tax=Sphingoaurantiacus capsulatus TaxID=1771310 RepID=A0ABV7XF11_9SPHN